MSEADFVPPTATEQASFDIGVLRVLGNLVGAVYQLGNSSVKEALIGQLEHDLANPPADWREPHHVHAYRIPLEGMADIIKTIDADRVIRGL